MKTRFIIDAGRDGIVNRVFKSHNLAKKFKIKKGIQGTIRKLSKK